MRNIRNVKVAVLGAAGFLGSHLTDYLIEERGCEVLAVDNLVVGRREFIHPMARFVHHDITGSEDHLRRLFADHAIQFVMNYIAYPYVPDSYARPVRTFDVNAMGALKVMNAAQEAGVEAMLQVSSAEIFGEGDTPSREGGQCLQLAEDSPAIPHSTYGASKLAIDALVRVRWREAKTPCIALRQFNAVGERDVLHPYVIPEVIQQLSEQRYPALQQFQPDGWAKAIVRLGMNSFRDFLYAGDQARMATELLERGEFGEVYNLGSETGIKIYDLARLIGKLMGFREVKIETDPARFRPWDILHLLSDNSKIYSVIEARPQVSLEEALRRTIDDFQERGGKWAWEPKRQMARA